MKLFVDTILKRGYYHTKKKKRETGSIKYNIRTKRQVRVGTGCDEGETVGEVNREPAEQGA